MKNSKTTAEPLVSVITTVYNTEEYCERCFDSVMNQSYKNIEFIIVNNASKGDIDKIARKYIDEYPERNIKLVTLKENKGLFNGRLAGAEAATGEYIGFIDSDDRISCDFYRCLVEKSIATGADMVAADFVYEDENGELSRDVLNPVPSYEFEYKGSDILKLFLDEAATAFYWNLIWNKLYTKELWDKCVPHYKKNKKPIVMCDDIAFTAVLYSYSERYVNTHSAKYYYLRRSSACSVANNSYEKYKSILTDIINVFDFIGGFLADNRLIESPDRLDEWKNRYFRIWNNGIKYSTLSGGKKTSLSKFYKQGMGIEECEETDPSDTLCINSTVEADDTLEKIKEQIMSEDISVVSFDIFDTLVLRNLWEPFDLFCFLEKKFNEISGSTVYIEFSRMRSYAEHIARTRICQPHSRVQEITLKQIYDAMQELYNFDKALLDAMMAEELKLEERFITRRETAYELYRLARYCGKKVICISDMYLPQDFLEKVLHKLGYTEISKIYLSSVYGNTKTNGKLYGIAAKELGTPARKILHIGDNYESDVIMAKNKGYRSVHLIKAQSAFCEKCPAFYKMFFVKKEAMYTTTMYDNMDTRCLMALVINKFFDDPFRIFMEDSEFDCDPYFIGYFCLGFYTLGSLKWIGDTQKERQFSAVNFIARDGYLMKKAYDLFFDKSDMPVSNYFYSSRNALLPCAVTEGMDFLGIPYLVYHGNYSPKKVIKTFGVLSAYTEEEMISKAKNAGFDADSAFVTKEAFDTFLLYFSEEFFDKETAEKYRTELREYIAKYFPENSCSFDVGYSGRTEGILSKLLGYPVTPLYLYRNGVKCENNKNTYGMQVCTMLDYFPSIAEEILTELFLSDTAPSCSGYIKKDGGFEPIFAEGGDQNYITKYFIEVMQKGAVDFVRDFKNRLGEYWDSFCLRKMDMTYPLEYFLKYSMPNDFYFLSSAYFDDNMALADQPALNDLRENDLYIVNAHSAKTDEVSFKAYVKHKLRNNPRLFAGAKKVYQIFKRR